MCIGLSLCFDSPVTLFSTLIINKLLCGWIPPTKCNFTHSNKGKSRILSSNKYYGSQPLITTLHSGHFTKEYLFHLIPIDVNSVQSLLRRLCTVLHTHSMFVSICTEKLHNLGKWSNKIFIQFFKYLHQYCTCSHTWLFLQLKQSGHKQMVLVDPSSKTTTCYWLQSTAHDLWDGRPVMLWQLCQEESTLHFLQSREHEKLFQVISIDFLIHRVSIKVQ